MTIRLAREGDLRAMMRLDRHVSEDMMLRKIRAGEVLLAEEDGAPVGLLRFGLFWDEIPFVNLLLVEEPMRGRGIGTALMQEWEAHMRSAEYKCVMTSTQASEYAQHFYRRLGYVDAGTFLPPGEQLELILIKRL